MSGTRMIFHLSDEDDVLEGAVAVLDPDSPGGSWESDTLELGVLPDPSASSLDDVDLSGPQGRDQIEAEPVVAFDEESEALSDELDGEGRGRPQERSSVYHRHLAHSGVRARGRRSGGPRRSRRVFAFGALGALVVLMVMIVVHPNRSALSVSSRVPTSTQGATLARSDPITGPPAAPKRVHRPAGARRRERRHLAVRVARREIPAPVTPSNPPTVVGQPVPPPPAAAVSDAPTPTPTLEPAREIPPSKPAPASTQSSSQGYAEFSFER
jgi:hypothetical protein